MILEMFPKHWAGRYSQAGSEGWGGVALSCTWGTEMEEAQSSLLAAVSLGCWLREWAVDGSLTRSF